MRDTKGSIVQYIRDVIEDSSWESGGVYDRWTNQAVAALAREYTWGELNHRETVTVTSGVLNEPALFDRMNRIGVDDGGELAKNSFEYRSAESIRDDFRFSGNWYMKDGVVESGQTAVLAHLSSGSTVIKNDLTASQTWFTSDIVGDRVMISGHEGLYEVTARTDSTISIYPEYRGPNDKSVSVISSPNGMRKWKLYTAKDLTYSGDVKVNYQKVHPLLYNNDDPILFEAPDSIRFRVEMIAARQNKYSTDAARLSEEYYKALRREIKANGGDAPTPMPQGFGGRPPLFVQRGRYFGAKK